MYTLYFQKGNKKFVTTNELFAYFKQLYLKSRYVIRHTGKPKQRLIAIGGGKDLKKVVDKINQIVKEDRKGKINKSKLDKICQL